MGLKGVRYPGCLCALIDFKYNCKTDSWTIILIRYSDVNENNSAKFISSIMLTI